jgi:glycerol kinase
MHKLIGKMDGTIKLCLKLKSGDLQIILEKGGGVVSKRYRSGTKIEMISKNQNFLR